MAPQSRIGRRADAIEGRTGRPVHSVDCVSVYEGRRLRRRLSNRARRSPIVFRFSLSIQSVDWCPSVHSLSLFLGLSGNAINRSGPASVLSICWRACLLYIVPTGRDRPGCCCCCCWRRRRRIRRDAPFSPIYHAHDNWRLFISHPVPSGPPCRPIVQLPARPAGRGGSPLPLYAVRCFIRTSIRRRGTGASDPVLSRDLCRPAGQYVASCVHRKKEDPEMP